ncbi:MAG: hypothetical protein P0119_02090 [Nitrospira sp.]|nr:hypothetical protein [Nitrospira sp.]
MSVQRIVLRPDHHEPALNMVGTQVTVLASNAETQSYGVTLQQGEEGTGPPPHSHHWDEAFRRLLQPALDLLGKAYWPVGSMSDKCDNMPLNWIRRRSILTR